LPGIIVFQIERLPEMRELIIIGKIIAEHKGVGKCVLVLHFAPIIYDVDF
jgi:hypothetical protein